MEKRNRYTAEFKAKVVLELLREEQTLNEVAAKYQLNPQMISQWKSDFVKNASTVFERNKDEGGKLRKEMEEKESRYQQIIGRDFCIIQKMPLKRVAKSIYRKHQYSYYHIGEIVMVKLC